MEIISFITKEKVTYFIRSDNGYSNITINNQKKLRFMDLSYNKLLLYLKEKIFQIYDEYSINKINMITCYHRNIDTNYKNEILARLGEIGVNSYIKNIQEIINEETIKMYIEHLKFSFIEKKEPEISFLNNERDLVLEIVKKAGWTFKYVSDKLKNDREIVLMAIENDSGMLEYAGENMKNDRDIVYRALNGNCFNIFNYEYGINIYLSEKTSIKKMYLEAIKMDPYAIYTASKKIKGDTDILMQLAKVNRDLFIKVCEELKINNKIINNIEYNSKNIKRDISDKEIELRKKTILENLKNDPFYRIDPDDYLWDDHEFIINLVREESLVLLGCPELTNDKEFMLKAVKENPQALLFVGDNLKNNESFIFEAMKIDELVFRFSSDKLRSDSSFILKLLKYYDESLLSTVNVKLLNDFSFMIKAIKINKMSIEYASSFLKNNKNFILEAIKIYPELFKYASDSLKNDEDLNSIIEKS